MASSRAAENSRRPFKSTAPAIPHISLLSPPDRRYTAGGSVVGWVQPTIITRIAVGCNHPAKGSQAPAGGISSVRPAGRLREDRRAPVNYTTFARPTKSTDAAWRTC